MDELRFLARRSEVGYTAHPSAAMVDEPEAVARDVQDQLTARMYRNQREQRHAKLTQTRAELRKQADWYGAQLRACEREIRRLDRKLAG